MKVREFLTAWENLLSLAGLFFVVGWVVYAGVVMGMGIALIVVSAAGSTLLYLYWRQVLW